MKTFFTLAVLLVVSNIQAQTTPAKARNTVYFEALGSGGIYSVNYERLFCIKEKRALGFRLGASYWSPSASAIVIGEVNMVTGAKNHHADFGLGLSGGNRQGSNESFVRGRTTNFYAVPRISYRYQKPEGGLMFRAGWTPFVSLSSNSSKAVYPLFFGVAIGKSF